jgi:formate dehydrogenase
MVFIRSLSRQLRRPATQFISAGSKPALATSSFARAPVSGAFSHARMLTASANLQGKVLLVLYDVSGFPSPLSD